eukprot:1763527-Rhodomonas_salina.4
MVVVRCRSHSGARIRVSGWNFRLKTREERVFRPESRPARLLFAYQSALRSQESSLQGSLWRV